MSGAYDPSVTGLEDFGVEDLKLPRLSIDHENGGYVDSLTPGVWYPKIEVIPLGLVKQRVLWPAAISEEKGNPLCKSTDHSTGYPSASDKREEQFPWAATGWNPGDFPKDKEGRTTLPCGTCRLKDWGSHPTDGKKTWCTEQHAVILLYGPEGSPPNMLAIFSAQRSSINVSKAFFGSMVRRQVPSYAVRAQWGVTPQMRGKNKYYVPTMVAVGDTDQGDWAVYQQNYLQVRGHIARPPRVSDDQQQANVNAAQLGQQNQMGGFGGNTWAPGQQAPVQQPVVIQQAPAVDPAYLEWQRQQAAATAHQVAQAQAAAAAVPVAQTPVTQSMPFPPMTPEVALPANPAPTGPSTGRDEEPLPF